MRRRLQIYFASSALVVVLVLDLERVVELQDHRSSPDLQGPGLPVVADVGVLDVKVAIVGGSDVDVEQQHEQEQEEGFEDETWRAKSSGSHVGPTKIILGRSSDRCFVSPPLKDSR